MNTERRGFGKTVVLGLIVMTSLAMSAGCEGEPTMQLRENHIDVYNPMSPWKAEFMQPGRQSEVVPCSSSLCVNRFKVSRI